MTKAVTFAIMLLFCTSCYAYSGGDGTSTNPYVIASSSDLVQLSVSVNTGSESPDIYYVLSSGISISTSWSPIGSGTAFSGHFDGSGRTISLDISSSDCALFGVVSSGASVISLDVVGMVRGSEHAGGIALTLNGGLIDGCMFSGNVLSSGEPYPHASGIVSVLNSGLVRNCSVSGRVRAEGDYARAGGIVSLVYGGSVESCSVESASIGAYGYRATAGGVVGQVNAESSDVTIEDSSFSGTADSNGYAGGIVGYMRGGTVRSSDVLCRVTGRYSSGGIAGSLRGNGRIEDSTVEFGAVVSSDSYAGGIVGMFESGTVRNNTAYAIVSGSVAAGGVIGEVTGTSAEIEGNTYSVLDYGIGRDIDGSRSNRGCVWTVVTEQRDFVLTGMLPYGYVGEEYSYTLHAYGVPEEGLVWSVVSGKMPLDLSMDRHGVISGIPEHKEVSRFVVHVESGDVLSADSVIVITITSSPSAVPITTMYLPDGVKDREYYAELKSTLHGVTWSCLSGRLPLGLILASDGAISGVPREIGTFEFVVKAEIASLSGVRSMNITVLEHFVESDDEIVSDFSDGGCEVGTGGFVLIVLFFMIRRRK